MRLAHAQPDVLTRTHEAMATLATPWGAGVVAVVGAGVVAAVVAVVVAAAR